MKIQPKNKKQLLKAALGEIPCDLVITNVQLVNVITGEIYRRTYSSMTDLSLMWSIKT